jgi:hypothetical protein
VAQIVAHLAQIHLAVAIAPFGETFHRFVDDLRDPQSHQIQQRSQPANPRVKFLLARRLARHRLHRRLDGCPQVILKVTGHAGFFARTLAGQRQRIAGQIARIDKPREERIQDHEGLPLARRRQRSSEGTPVEFSPTDFAAVHHLACCRLWIGKKALIREQVSVSERGERLTQFDGESS